MTEFSTSLPRYATELYQIYRHARIMALDVKMDVVNTSGAEPLLSVIGVLPLVNCNAITNPQTIMSVPGAIFKQIGLSTGLSKATLRKRCVTEKELGEMTIGSQTYLQTYSEALSTAVWTELPAVYLGTIAARNGATWTGIIDYSITYHLRFSEYNIPSLGLDYGKMVPYHPDEAESMDEKEWVKPPDPRAKPTKKLSGASSAYHR